jgi:alkylhydroperoxidase family enzyme
MGHSEMLLAVAGMNANEVKKHTKKLADGDWAAFSPAERQAFQFAHKLAREPWAVTAKEVERLTETFGRHGAIDLIWYAAWGNYMTRIADAFQLPLERENFFARPTSAKDHTARNE